MYDKEKGTLTLPTWLFEKDVLDRLLATLDGVVSEVAWDGSLPTPNDHRVHEALLTTYRMNGYRVQS